jgi:hypothetical protein
MVDSNLKNKLRELGFPMLESAETSDLNRTLSEAVKSADLRIWEGFPVILANVGEQGSLKLDLLKSHLKKRQEKAILNSLLIMSLALYKALKINFGWSDELLQSFAPEERKTVNEFARKIANDGELKFSGYNFSSAKLKATFTNYFRKTNGDLSDLISMKAQLSLEYALSQIFSPKQKELFLKKIRGDKFTKTEREYFSRSVRKKVLALSNSDLHSLAKKLLE